MALSKTSNPINGELILAKSDQYGVSILALLTNLNSSKIIKRRVRLTNQLNCWEAFIERKPLVLFNWNYLPECFLFIQSLIKYLKQCKKFDQSLRGQGNHQLSFRIVFDSYNESFISCKNWELDPVFKRIWNFSNIY